MFLSVKYHKVCQSAEDHAVCIDYRAGISLRGQNPGIVHLSDSCDLSSKDPFGHPLSSCYQPGLNLILVLTCTRMLT